MLAAGAGRRFGTSGGGDKLLAEWRGRPLIEPVLATVARAEASLGIAGALVVVPPGDTRISTLARAHGIRAIVAERASRGMAESLRAGLAALTSMPTATAALILLGDQPLVTPATIDALVHAGADSRAALVRPRYRAAPDAPGHPALIGRDHWGLANEATGDRGLDPVVRARALVWTEVWVEGDNPDIDTPADLDRLRKG